MAEKAASITSRLEAMTPYLKEYFNQLGTFREKYAIDAGDSEYVLFDTVVLEVADRPLSAVVANTSKGLIPIIGPRLELHLNRGTRGVHSVQTQLGRIARYIDTRGLQEGYPILTTTTYPKLSQAVEEIIPIATKAVATYLPSNLADHIVEGIEQRCEDFEQRNGYTHEKKTIDSLIIATESFVRFFENRSE